MNCANCGEGLLDGDVFCTECGTSVADVVPVSSESEDEALGTTGEEDEGALTTGDPTSVDLASAEEYDDRTVRRPSRRFPQLAGDPDQSIGENPPIAQESSPLCQACGEPLEPGAPFCTACGERRHDVEPTETAPTDEGAPAGAPPVPAEPVDMIESIDIPGGSDSAQPTREALLPSESESDVTRVEVTGSTPDVAESAELPAAHSCSTCGEPLEAGAVFCTNCGGRKDPEPEEEQHRHAIDESTKAGGDSCSSCGTTLDPGAAFCTECGAVQVPPDGSTAVGVEQSAAAPPADAEPGSEDELVSEDESVPEDELVSEDEPVSQDESGSEIAAPPPSHLHCSVCSHPLEAGAVFCTNCGATVTEESDPAPAPTSTFCIMCGHSMPDGVTFCTNCGAQQADEGPAVSERTIAVPVPEVSEPEPVASATSCNTCGEPVVAGSTFCTNCGSGVASPREPIVSASDPPPAVPPSATGAASFCIACGHRLEPNDEFCIKCGLPRDGTPDETVALTEHATQTMVPPAPAPGFGAAPLPEEQKRRKRSLLPLWITIGVGLLAAGAWFGWQWFNADDADQEVAALEEDPGGETSSEVTEAPAPDDQAGAVPVSTDDDTCQSDADQAREATVALMDAFASTDLIQLVDLARIGRQSLPGAGAFDAANAPLLQASDSPGCSVSDQESLYSTAMAAVAAPANNSAAVIYSAGSDAYGFDGADLLTRASAALRMYPTHGGVVMAVAHDGDLPRWTVILESLEVGDFSQDDALAHAAAYSNRNIVAEVFLSDDYESLNPGYWVVHTGMYVDRDDATARCSQVRSSVDFCYDRYIQIVPTTAGPNGACGPYGRYDVIGIASGSVLEVRVGPSTGQQVLGTYPRSQTGILAAGPPVSVGSTSWTPLGMNGKIGWVLSQYLVADSVCAGTTPPPAGTTSCPAVAVATADLLQSVVAAAEAGDVSGIAAVTAIDMSTFDTIAGQLVVDAGANGCDIAELNNLVAAQHGRIAASGPFANLVRDILGGQDFFSEA